MNHNSKYFAVGAAILGVMAGATLLAFADTRDAQWRLSASLSLNRVHFTVRQSNDSGNWVHGNDVPLDNFRGFSLSMLASPGPAKFEYVGDAGRLLCEGRFMLGTGSGTYTFAPDRGFVSSLQQMGYSAPDEEQLFSMLMMNIGREFAREIRDTGVKASARDLIQLKIHGIDVNYIREARLAGYQNFSVDDYVQLRIHGVAAPFLRELKAAGYDLRAGDIAQLRIHGVDSEYIRDLKNYGLKPDAVDLSQLRMHGVTPQYLKDLTDAGYGDLRLDEINRLRAHGVEPGFAQEARRLGYDFTPDELAQLRTRGVDGAYLKRLQSAGMRNLNAEQIAKLRMHGVD